MSTYDIAGFKFGYLTVLGRDESSIGERNSKWFCRCICGNITSVARCSLVRGHTTSCGCKHFESHNATHKQTGTRIYRIWRHMKARCYCPNDNNKTYINRGISVCDEWKNSFEQFSEWAISNGYRDDLTIERINNDGNYTPENCKWISHSEQMQNMTVTIRINYDGKERCLHTVCREIGFPYKTAHRRYHRLKQRGEEITSEKLFAPIHTEKIAKRYRHS